MSVALLNGLLWIPFAVICLIAGIIFLISGYKRGLWRALISLGATAVAAVLSVLFANLLGTLLAPAVRNALPDMELEDTGFAPELVAALVDGAIAVVLSLVLFSLFLLIFSIVLKCVANHVRKDLLQVSSKGMKWAGLGVRAVDAVLFALLMVLPLYGTLATYIPVAQTVVDMQSEESGAAETKVYLDAMKSHPVVVASSVGPAQWVYGGLSQLDAGETSVNIASMAKTADGLIARYEAVEHAINYGSDVVEPFTELAAYVRDDVIEEDWCYDLVIPGLVSMLEQEEQNLTEPSEKLLAQEIISLVEMSKAEFQDTTAALLDFVVYAMENGVGDLMESGDATAILEEDFLEALGSTLNHNEKLAQIKGYIYTNTIMTAIGDNSQETINAIRKSVNTEPLPQEQWVQEAQAFMGMVMGGGDEETVIEAMKALPSLDMSKLEKLLD